MDNYLASSTAVFPQPNVESPRWSCCCRFFRWCGFVGAETLVSPWTAFRAFPGVLVFTPRVITQTLKLTSRSQSHQYNQVHLAGEELREPIPLNFPRVFISSMLLLFNKIIMCSLYWVLSLLSIIYALIILLHMYFAIENSQEISQYLTVCRVKIGKINIW